MANVITPSDLMVWDLQKTLVDLGPAQKQMSADFPVIGEYFEMKRQLAQAASGENMHDFSPESVKEEMQALRPEVVEIFTRELESGKYHLPVLPGVLDHLQAMQGQGYRHGIFTGTPLTVVDGILKSNPGLPECIDLVVNLPQIIDQFGLGANATKEDAAVNLGMYATFAEAANGGQVETYTDDEASRVVPVVAAQQLLARGGADLYRVIEQFPALASVVEMHENQGGIGSIYHLNAKADTSIVGKEGYTQINRIDLARPMHG